MTTFTRRDSLDREITGHGSAPVADPSGTSPMPRPASRFDPELLEAFNAGVQRAANADWIRCGVCGRTFGQPSSLAQHANTHKPPA